MTADRGGDRGDGPTLAPRELEVLEHLVRGQAPKQIARELLLSVETVRWYSKRVYRALGVNNRASAVRVAIELGLVGVDRATRPAVAPPLRRLIGREAEVRHLLELVEANRLVTVVGMGGVGKTALASATAAVLERRGVEVSEALLQDVDDEMALVARLANALGVGLREPGSDPWATLAGRAASTDGVILVDNVEQLQHFGVRFEQLLQAAPGLRMIATSRVPIGVVSEVVMPLSGLDLPRADAAPSADADSVALFLAEARGRRPDLEVTEDVLEAATEVCVLLGGLPLAIVLAASWIDTLSPLEVVESLRSSTDLLTTSGLSPSRHRSVASVIDASIEQFPPEHLSALARLSVFAGGFTPDAAREVTGLRTSTLAALKRASLIQDDGDRCRVHRLVAQRLRDRLEEASEVAAATAAHRDYFSRLSAGLIEALRGADRSVDQAQAIEMLSREDENLRRAWTSAVTTRDAGALDTMAEPMTTWLTQLDDYASAMRGLTAAVDALGESTSAPRLRAIFEWFSWVTGTLDPDEVSTPALATSDDAALDQESRMIAGAVAVTLLATALGRDDDAERLAVTIEGDPALPSYWDVRRRLAVATIVARRGDHDGSITTLEEGIDDALGQGNHFGAHMLLTTVIFVALRAGRTERIDGYARLAEAALAAQPAQNTAHAINAAQGLLELWSGDASGIPERLTVAEEIGGLEVIFYASLSACLEAMYAGFTGDLTLALQARARIDADRVGPIRPEPLIYAEWGVALAHAHAGRLDAADRHAARMRDLELSCHAVGEHRMLQHVIDILRVSSGSPSPAEVDLAESAPPTLAAGMYRQWAPLADCGGWAN